MDAERTGGLFRSTKSLLGGALALLQVRLALLAVEVEEEKARLAGLIVYGALALLLLGAGAVFLAVLITVLLWDTHRVAALAVFATLFLAGGAAALAAALGLARTPSRLFSSSLAELSRDRAALNGEKPQ